MKTISAPESSRSNRKIVAAGVILLAVFGLTSCNSKIYFLPSTIVPAAQGYVEIKQDDNKNYELNVNIDDLAESKKLAAGKSTYVVWIESEKGSFQNIGQLTTGTSMFSKQRQASVHGLSSSKPSKVFITAEDNPGARYPSSLIILTTKSF